MRTEKDFNRAGFYISIPVEEVESFRKQKKRSLSLLKVRPGSLYLFRLWVSGRNKLTLTILKIIEALFYQVVRVVRNSFESDLIRSVIGVENPRPPLNLSAAKLNSTNVNNYWKQMNDIFTTLTQPANWKEWPHFTTWSKLTNRELTLKTNTITTNHCPRTRLRKELFPEYGNTQVAESHRDLYTFNEVYVCLTM